MRQVLTNATEAGAALAALIDPGASVVGFTGAGISTECGVPDFRSPGSPWMVNKPVPFQAFVASAEARKEAWRRKFAMDDTYAGAEPGQGHRALAALHAAGRMPLLVTQNIDGLHQRSGLPDDAVIELHGNGGYAKCLECDERHELSVIRPVFEAGGEAPNCRSCSGLLKSATISFGQAMPQHAMARAAKAALAADIFLAIGSSLVVFPAADLPRAAAENGAKLVIVNREPTHLDGVADLVVRADIGPTLAAMRTALGL
ncbi:MAG: SIR2 family NAD-dependent protein deacylase [Beijerinckiaceae bacterium]